MNTANLKQIVCGCGVEYNSSKLLMAPSVNCKSQEEDGGVVAGFGLVG